MEREEKLRRERRLGWILLAVLVPPVVIGLVALRFIYTPHLVPTGSMIPTIHRNDRVFVNRLAYAFGEAPKRGDVVAYRSEAKLIHRIVAGPGDTFEMRDNVVLINGKPQHEPYKMVTPDIPSMRSLGPVTIPAGHYFLLGDNRDNANDSRYRGFISEDAILGRMSYVLHVGACE